MNSFEWALNSIRWLMIGGLHVVTGKYFIDREYYGGHVCHKAEDGNARLYELIENSRPFAYCRYSYTEMEIMIRSVTQEKLKIPSTNRFEWLDIFCGKGESNFEGALKYRHLMEGAFKEADMLGVWENLHMGDALLKMQERADDLYVTDARSVEAYYYDGPWTAALKGRKVLVVSPFSEAIKYQYQRRDKIWPGRNILPEFALDTEDSIWFYAGKRDERFNDWFEAYEFLYERIMSHDFDIVILACGYFGFALASRIKLAGKQAVHMGGATQILFGIKGKRWDDNPAINRFYNDSWIRADQRLKPDDDHNLDDGCYW